MQSSREDSPPGKKFSFHTANSVQTVALVLLKAATGVFRPEGLINFETRHCFENLDVYETIYRSTNEVFIVVEKILFSNC